MPENPLPSPIMTSTPTMSPTVSVVIPVRNAPAQLRMCLESLRTSRFEDFETIVVDDASTDNTAEVAESLGASVVRLEQRGGPAAARNRGAESARGEIVLFIDADCCVNTETLGLVAEEFEDEKVDAVFGSYDSRPWEQNILSQYRNLMHHFVHQEGNERPSTFWTGCGAIRRGLFGEIGGFNPDYRRPCIEDIELGVRLHKAGHRIVLNKQIHVTHLKRWTFWGMLKADIRDRALPWTELILREGSMPNDLNLKLSHRISAMLAYGLLGCLLAGAWFVQSLLILPVVFILAVVGLDYWSIERRIPTTVRIAAALGVIIGNVFLFIQFHVYGVLPIALLLGIVLLNWRFYVFLARERQFLFAALALPLHVFFYLYSGAAFAYVWIVHHVSALFARLFRRNPPPAYENRDQG